MNIIQQINFKSTFPVTFPLFPYYYHKTTKTDYSYFCSLKDEKSEHIRVSSGEGCRGER